MIKPTSPLSLHYATAFHPLNLTDKRLKSNRFAFSNFSYYSLKLQIKGKNSREWGADINSVWQKLAFHT